MQKKYWFIPIICWLTLITLAFFSPFSNHDTEPQYPKNTSVELAFSNPNGRLLPSQLQNIQETMQWVQNHSEQLGICNIKTPNQNFITRHFQQAPDHSLITYQATLKKSSKLQTLRQVIQTPQVAAQISNPVPPDFDNFTTVKISLLLGFVIIVGLYFRSIFAPIVVSALSIVASQCGWFLSKLWSIFFHLPMTMMTELVLTFSTLVLLPLCIILLLREYCNHFEVDPNATNLLKKWKLITYKTPALLLVLITPLSLMSQTPIVRSISYLVPSVLIVWLILFTLLPLILELIEELFFWPSPPWIFDPEHHSWHYLTSMTGRFYKIFLSLLLLLILFLVSISPNRFPTLNASDHSNLVQSHLISDSTRTIMLKIKAPFEFEKPEQFSDIDHLTNQLNDSKQVQSVTSITQPIGNPWPIFSLKRYLTTTGDELTGISDSLTALQTESANVEKQLQQANFDELSAELEMLDKNLEINTQDIDNVYHQADDLTNQLDQVTDDSKPSDNLTSIKAIIKKLNTNLKNIAILKQNSQILASEQQIITENITAITQNIVKLRTALDQLSPKLSTTLEHVQTTKQHLKELKESKVLNGVYIGKNELTTATFKDSQCEYSSHDHHSTFIKVELKKKTDAVKSIQQLQTTLPQLVQSTSLQHCQFSFAGILMQEYTKEKLFQKDLKHVVILMLILLIIAISLFKVQHLSRILISIISSLMSLLIANALTQKLSLEIPSVSMFIFINLLTLFILLLFSNLVFSISQATTILLKQVDQVINLIYMALFVLCGSLVLSGVSFWIHVAVFFAITLSIFMILFPIWTTIFHIFISKRE